MAVHNNRSLLDNAVESVLNQTYTNFEFIIIYDGSTDGSTERLQQYAAQDERIRLTVQANAGLTRSLNRGLAKARGAYIARMDGDDICRPDRLAQQVRHLDRHADHVLVGGQVLLVDEKGSVVRDSVMPPATPTRVA
jgi:glycosyltransferase involved in cell wall biosynthesis